MAGTSNRPKAPHLQIWRWGPAMFVSILHRVTGSGLALAGLGLLLWWLALLGGDGTDYETFLAFTKAWYCQVVLIGLSWAFFTHLATGLRHFVLDIGAGFELVTNARWSVLTPLIALVLTGAMWGWILRP